MQILGAALAAVAYVTLKLAPRTLVASSVSVFAMFIKAVNLESYPESL